jgi:hypothetical protein
LLLEDLERRHGSVGVQGGVDRLEITGDLFALAAPDEPQAVADQMHVMPTSA